MYELYSKPSNMLLNRRTVFKQIIGKLKGRVITMNNTFNVQDFLNIAVKRIKLVIIIPFACVIVCFLMSSYLINPVYESQVDLLVNQTQTEDEKVTGTTDVEMNLLLIETYQFIIKSSKIRELVYEQFNHQ